MNPKEIVNRYENLKSERRSWDYQAELIERFVIPGKGRFFQDGNDSENSINWRHRELYDQTAPNMLVLLASNLHSGLMNPSSVWFSPRLSDPTLGNQHDEQEWLDECGLRMHRSLNGSNLHVESNELFQDAVGFGTGVQIHEEADENELLDQFGGHVFSTPMAREIYFDEDWRGNIVRLFRRRQYTAIQLIDKFGRAALPQEILDMNDGDRFGEKIDVVFAVYPRRDDWRMVDVSRYLAPKARPWEGKYVIYETREQIGPTYGYHEMPAYVLRWQRTAGSKFGHSPGINTLSDVLSLNQLREMLHEATEKATDPPLQTVQRGVIGDLETFSGGLTVTRGKDSIGPLVDPRFYRVDVGFRDLDDVRNSIREAFFVDQLQLKDSPQMTATEVRARMELMQRFLGPVLNRIKSDYLDPLVDHTFWMMARKGALPPPPPSLEDKRYDIEYLGPLARAQRLGDVEAIERLYVTAASIAEIKPEVLDNIDHDEALRHSGHVLGVPAKIMKSDADLKRMRRARKQEQDQAKVVAAAPELAGAAKDAAQAQRLLDVTPGVGGVQ